VREAWLTKNAYHYNCKS